MEDKIKYIVFKFLDELNFDRNIFVSLIQKSDCYGLGSRYAFRIMLDEMGKVTIPYVSYHVVDYVMKFIPIDYEVMSNIIEEWIKDRYGR